MTSSLTSRFRLGSRRVLLLGGARARLYRWSGRRMLEPLEFPVDETGVGGFSEYLRLSAPDPVYLLVDLVEEDFRLDTVPHVFGRDRRAVIRNKQNRLFRDSRYARAVVQGREPDGRRDDKILFSSVIRPELLDPWLGELHRRRVPLVGIYSLPVVSQALLKHIPVSSDNALLVSLQAGSGLRQTYFEQSQLKVSRLAAVPRLEPNQLAAYILQEVERVRRYLNSLRLIGRGGPLDVYILSHGPPLGDLERLAQDSITTRFHLVDLAAVADKLGGAGLVQEGLPNADRLYAHLLAAQSPPNHYARPADTRYHTLRRAGTAMTMAALLVLAGGLGWSALEFARALDHQLEIATLARQAEFYERRYQKGKAELPELPADGMQIRQAVQTVETVERYQEDPLDMMALLSAGLEGFGELQIDQLEWESGADPAGAPASPRRQTPRSRGARGGRGQPRGAYYQMARVRGHIAPFDGDYRRALEKVNRFADAVAELEGVTTVNVLKLPLEISSHQRLSGVASLSPDIGEARFELRVVLRTRGEPS